MPGTPRATRWWYSRLVRPLPIAGRTTKEGHLLAALDLDHERGCYAAPSLNVVYEVGIELGEGRTAVVHEGRDKRAAAGTWGRCALKLFQAQEMRETDEAAEMIRDEVAVLLVLPRHPCVVQLLQVVSTPDVIVLALELVAGGDLFSMIEASGPCPEARARALLLQVSGELTLARLELHGPHALVPPRAPPSPPPPPHPAPWPLHDIAITNIVWCMAYKGSVGGGRILRNGRAIVLQLGRR